jgi:putative membrane protein
MPDALEPTPPPPPDPRVLLAAERTLLAWIRTGLALMGFGFVVARFGLFLREMAAAGRAAAEPPHLRASQWVGTALILLGVLVHVLSGVLHARFVRAYARGEAMRPRAVSPGTILAAVLAALGLALAWYLLRVE